MSQLGLTYHTFAQNQKLKKMSGGNNQKDSTTAIAERPAVKAEAFQTNKAEGKLSLFDKGASQVSFGATTSGSLTGFFSVGGVAQQRIKSVDISKLEKFVQENSTDRQFSTFLLLLALPEMRAQGKETIARFTNALPQNPLVKEDPVSHQIVGASNPREPGARKLSDLLITRILSPSKEQINLIKNSSTRKMFVQFMEKNPGTINFLLQLHKPELSDQQRQLEIQEALGRNNSSKLETILYLTIVKINPFELSEEMRDVASNPNSAAILSTLAFPGEKISPTILTNSQGAKNAVSRLVAPSEQQQSFFRDPQRVAELANAMTVQLQESFNGWIDALPENTASSQMFKQKLRQTSDWDKAQQAFITTSMQSGRNVQQAMGEFIEWMNTVPRETTAADFCIDIIKPDIKYAIDRNLLTPDKRQRGAFNIVKKPFGVCDILSRMIFGQNLDKYRPAEPFGRAIQIIDSGQLRPTVLNPPAPEPNPYETGFSSRTNVPANPSYDDYGDGYGTSNTGYGSNTGIVAAPKDPYGLETQAPTNSYDEYGISDTPSLPEDDYSLRSGNDTARQPRRNTGYGDLEGYSSRKTSKTTRKHSNSGANITDTIKENKKWIGIGAAALAALGIATQVPNIVGGGLHEPEPGGRITAITNALDAAGLETDDSSNRVCFVFDVPVLEETVKSLRSEVKTRPEYVMSALTSLMSGNEPIPPAYDQAAVMQLAQNLSAQFQQGGKKAVDAYLENLDKSTPEQGRESMSKNLYFFYDLLHREYISGWNENGTPVRAAPDDLSGVVPLPPNTNPMETREDGFVYQDPTRADEICERGGGEVFLSR